MKSNKETGKRAIALEREIFKMKEKQRERRLRERQLKYKRR